MNTTLNHTLMFYHRSSVSVSCIDVFRLIIAQYLCPPDVVDSLQFYSFTSIQSYYHQCHTYLIVWFMCSCFSGAHTYEFEGPPSQ